MGYRVKIKNDLYIRELNAMKNKVHKKQTRYINKLIEIRKEQIKSQEEMRDFEEFIESKYE